MDFGLASVASVAPVAIFVLLVFGPKSWLSEQRGQPHDSQNRRLSKKHTQREKRNARNGSEDREWKAHLPVFKDSSVLQNSSTPTKATWLKFFSHYIVQSPLAYHLHSRNHPSPLSEATTNTHTSLERAKQM